jgi:hypothetical protein
MGTGIVVPYSDTPCDLVRMLLLDGSMKVSEGSTVVLCIDGAIKDLELRN